MKKLAFILLLVASVQIKSGALVINEIMSNPTGDDGGREWIELYNDKDAGVDLSTLTISIKGGSPIAVMNLQGGTMLGKAEYAIVGSTVSGATKFLLDYPSYAGMLFKSAISLVNTGVTSLEIKVGGVSTDILASYTASKEGFTLSRFGTSFSTGSSSPGAENQAVVEDTSSQASSTSQTQGTIAQASTPSSDIVLYIPTEKTVVAGAESYFSIFGLTRGGNKIDNLKYEWAFGDGGQGVGSSTMYRYVYPGRYILQVEGGNGLVAGYARMNVRVVAPEIFIKGINTGKYGAYIDIENPNPYELDFSQWKLLIDGAAFPFPKNTLIAGNGITHLSGIAMGFASTTIASSTIIKIVFPNMEEVTRYTNSAEVSPALIPLKVLPKIIVQNITPKQTIPSISQAKTEGKVLGTTSQNIQLQQKPLVKDTRIVSFFRSLFGRK